MFLTFLFVLESLWHIVCLNLLWRSDPNYSKYGRPAGSGLILVLASLDPQIPPELARPERKILYRWWFLSAAILLAMFLFSKVPILEAETRTSYLGMSLAGSRSSV